MSMLVGKSTSELRDVVASLGEPGFRGQQLAEWIYRRGAVSFDEMTNLPTELRRQLAQRAEISHLPVELRVPSKDGSVKLLLRRTSALRLSSGHAPGPLSVSEMGSGGEVIETVGLPCDDRVTCCVSTQVGCPIGCLFCATGLSGFTGNLTAGEIVVQVLAVQRDLHAHHASRITHSVARLTTHHSPLTINHVVFMGMGEPLLNYANTLKAVHLLNREVGIAMRHITVSTVGMVPQMKKLAAEKLQLTLAVSLHAPTNELRNQLVPGTRAFTVDEIMDAAKFYAQTTGRRVTFEYVLLRDVNDSAGDARRLAGLLRDAHAHVNLIPFNPVDETDFQSPPPHRVKRFREILEAAKILVTQRVQRGADANAACGQLRRRHVDVA